MDKVLLAVMVVGIGSIALREVCCWYWKVNEIIRAQAKTNELLSEANERLGQTVKHLKTIADSIDTGV